MKLKWGYFLIIPLLAGVFASGAFWDYKCNRVISKPDLGKPGEPTHGVFPITKPVVKPAKETVPGGYIVIDPKLNAARDLLNIHAYNRFTYTDQAWPIKCSSVPLDDSRLLLMPMISGALSWDKTLQKLTPGYGGQLIVGYNWGPVGIGVAPGFLKFPAHLDFICSVGAMLRIKTN